jgi:2-dehydro-3-deoxyphosphooctonate aldolase (KDO 8-P synthase)
MKTRSVHIGDVVVGGGAPLTLVAGPCVMESETVVLRIAEKIREVTARLGIPTIFKSSYLKDNRSSAQSFQGLGVDAGLSLLAKVRDSFDMPVLTDVHSVDEARTAADAVDVIQVPAYLCMQTSIVQAAGRTGKPVNVKKGQFIHPQDMRNVIRKLEEVDCRDIILTERGACFGYRNLVVDFRSLPDMRSFGYPVMFDPTHAIRNYGISSSDPTGGSPEYIPALTRAGIAVGCDALFMETHDDLENALCDAASMLPFERLESVLQQVMAVDDACRQTSETPV